MKYSLKVYMKIENAKENILHVYGKNENTNEKKTIYKLI